MRNIELLGEAARRIPQDVRDRASGIEWQKIIALRNILIHGYFGIETTSCRGCGDQQGEAPAPRA